MSKPAPLGRLKFYMTLPGPCPYLPDREERKLFAPLHGRDGPAAVDALTHSGFRRSQGVMYRPACEACSACQSVRVRAQDFEPSRSQTRTLRRNGDLVGAARPPAPTAEQYDLFAAYISSRHGDGGMADMTFGDYAMMIAETTARTEVVEYRDAERRLLAVILVDRLSDGVSLVYSFFAPEQDRRSLGAFMILDQIRATKAAGLPHVYLGYWISGSRKMAYKADYQPLDVFDHRGWRSFSQTIDPERAGDAP